MSRAFMKNYKFVDRSSVYAFSEWNLGYLNAGYSHVYIAAVSGLR